jgi:hypothetical protein
MSERFWIAQRQFLRHSLTYWLAPFPHCLDLSVTLTTGVVLLGISVCQCCVAVRCVAVVYVVVNRCCYASVPSGLLHSKCVVLFMLEWNSTCHYNGTTESALLRVSSSVDALCVERCACVFYKVWGKGSMITVKTRSASYILVLIVSSIHHRCLFRF